MFTTLIDDGGSKIAGADCSPAQLCSAHLAAWEHHASGADARKGSSEARCDACRRLPFHAQPANRARCRRAKASRALTRASRSQSRWQLALQG